MRSSRKPLATVGSSPVEDVLLVARFRREKGFTFETTSLPGHMIQITVQGGVHLEVSGRQHDLRPGQVIWFHEDEHQRGAVIDPPWIFYSVNFIAPSLPPPAFESRLRRGGESVIRQFEQLHRVWSDDGVPPAIREFRVHAALLELLTHLTTPAQQAMHMDPRARLWWELETELRKDLRRPITLATMAQIAKRSPATIARSCVHAVGMPPLKRLKRVRLSLARGLVWSSRLSLTEIAERVGYDRVHEFSRDFRKQFGVAPSYDRVHSDYDALRREIARGYGPRYGVPRPARGR